MAKRPNILFILSDQHNASVMGCAGNELIRTPHLDKLAAGGMRFGQAYCQNPLCVPSRSSLLSGQHSCSNGIYTNTDFFEPNSCTIPRTLSEHGYRTCLIGKAHFNGEQFHGYQERPYGDLYGQAHQPDPRRTSELGPAGLGDLVDNAGATQIPLPMTQTEICVAEAAKWLQTHVDRQSDQAFMLSVNFDKPHFPVRCPEHFYEHYKGKIQVPEVPDDYFDKAVPFVQKAMDKFGFEGEDGNNYLSAYYGCIEWMDDAIGRLLEVLEYLGLDDNTYVIYSSDHGDLCGEKGAWNKTLFFDSATKVPLIIRGPGIERGQVSKDIVGLCDMFPSICEMTNLPIPDSCEGVSILPLLHNSGALQREHIFCESAFLGEPSAAGCMIRQDKWKYAYYLDGDHELYNIEDDSGEWENLANESEHQELIATFKNKVIEFWKPDEYLDRYAATPRSSREKHFFEFSNQFFLGNGIVANGRP